MRNRITLMASTSSSAQAGVKTSIGCGAHWGFTLMRLLDMYRNDFTFEVLYEYYLTLRTIVKHRGAASIGCPRASFPLWAGQGYVWAGLVSFWAGLVYFLARSRLLLGRSDLLFVEVWFTFGQT